jgi:hypothetical protein
MSLKYKLPINLMDTIDSIIGIIRTAIYDRTNLNLIDSLKHHLSLNYK